MSNDKPIGIVDIFAGPGGLSEGFASVGDRSNRPFRIALSIEKDAAAHRTLRLRSLVHELNDAEYRRYIEILNTGIEPTESVMEAEFPEKWELAQQVARKWELSEKSRSTTENLLAAVRNTYGDRIGLIGGPPCQVYSLVGRSRNAKNHKYDGDKDHRHTLYKEYIHVLKYLKPAFFVMENVKGMLSSRHESQYIFPLVREDLEQNGSYTLIPLASRTNVNPALSPELVPVDHHEFIVKMEDFGVPQKRHRIIILGLRTDIIKQLPPNNLGLLKLKPLANGPSVQDIIQNLPDLRSGLSKRGDSSEKWFSVIDDAIDRLLVADIDEQVRHEVNRVAECVSSGSWPRARSSHELREWWDEYGVQEFIRSEGLRKLHHHETRTHIPGDLARYIFAAAFARAWERSPRPTDYPDYLAPAHQNWNSGNFNDRFRVQVGGNPSSTIMSHISKDGHYYIHPDPAQARSLTVREAARLQTFPDDYIFLGNRTQQYQQVGNAVPPYLARQIAQSLQHTLFPLDL